MRTENTRHRLVKRRYFNILFAFFLVFFFFALFEGVLRLLHFGTFMRYQMNDELGMREIVPDQRTYSWMGRVPVSINSHGYRGKDFSRRKPEGACRILTIGDSVTFGTEIRDDETFAHHLESILNASQSDVRFEVINLGVPNYSLLDHYRLLKGKALDYDPDMVIVGFVLNDVYFSADARGEIPFKEQVDMGRIGFLSRAAILFGRVEIPGWLRRSALTHFLEYIRYNALQSSMKRYQEENREAFQQLKRRQLVQRDAMWGEETMAMLRDISVLIRDRGVEPLYLIFPAYFHLHTGLDASNFQRTVAAIAEEFDIPIINFYPIFRDYPGDPNDLYVDPGHFNDAGNRLVARTISRRILSRAE